MAEEKQGGKIITPLGWENNSQNLKVDLTQRSNKKAELGAKRGVLSWAEFQKSDEFKVIKRQKMPNGKWQFVPNNEQLRKLVHYEEISLGEIDTSEVTDMSFLFSFDERKVSYLVSSEFFNWRKDFSGIAGWDTSRVTTFEGMFYRADNFNEDINKWNTSSVTNMVDMFEGAKSFNQPLDKWDTSSVINMRSMFFHARKFNQPLDKWDTSSVTNMRAMFGGATNFNQPLNKWDTSSVTNMSGMFMNATNFNQPLNEWDTSSVTNMSSMFWGAKSFNQPLDKWDTSRVTDMKFMFLDAKNFNQNLMAWRDKLDKVKDMSSMFSGAESLIYDFFSWWETSEVCGLKDRIKDSGVEKLRDAHKKIKDKIEKKYEQKKELAKMLGLDEKELEIIPKPALSNFDIYKVVVNEEDFLKSILPYEGEGEKVVKNWLVKDVAYRVYLLRYDEKSDEFTQDKSEWDFAFCKVFESWFMIKKNSRWLSNNDNEKLPSQLNEALLLFRIYQGQNMNELEEQSKRKFNKDKEYVSQNRELTIYFEQIAMHILDGSVEFFNQKIVQDIVYAVVLAKAYNIKMENLRDAAKESANDTRRLKECYKEVCDFDLKKYYSIPITQNGKDSNANVVLMEVWHYISNVCFVTQQHDELKDVIAQMSRVLTDDKRDSQSWWFSVAAVAIAFVSFVVAAISAVPVIEKWLG